LNNLGIIFVRLQNYEKAEEQFKTGIKLAPNNDQSYLNLARLYAIEAEKEKARQILQELLLVQPQNPAARQALEVLR
jgi:Flp pilus assembly protein TadD